jgi:hypothetical protein
MGRGKKRVNPILQSQRTVALKKKSKPEAKMRGFNHGIIQAAIISTLLVSAVCTCCKNQKSEWRGEIQEENGIAVVRNPKKPMFREDVFVMETELTLGTREGKEEFMFQGLSDLDIDKDENIYALDSKSAQVRVFDRNGEYLRTIGGKGQGPGEMMGPQFLQITDEGLVVYDPRTRRFLIFSLEGRYLRQISTARIPHPIHPIKLDSKGNLIAELVPPPPLGGIELAEFTPDLKLKMMISKEERDDWYLKREHRVVSPSLDCAVSRDDSVVWGNSRKYEFFVLDPEGKLKRRIIRPCKPERVTDRERERLLEVFSRLSVGKLGFKPIVPDFFPFFQGLSIDWEGRIFVKTYEKVKDSDRFYYYDVFDKEGRYVAKAAIKTRSRQLCWKKNKLYTIESDEEGFQTISRFNILWSYPSPAKDAPMSPQGNVKRGSSNSGR